MGETFCKILEQILELEVNIELTRFSATANQYRSKPVSFYRDENMRATLEPRTLSVTSEGLEEKSVLAQTKIKWKAVDNIAVMPTFTVVSIQKVPSIIIPENQVVAGDYQSFVQACREYFERGGRC